MCCGFVFMKHNYSVFNMVIGQWMYIVPFYFLLCGLFLTYSFTAIIIIWYDVSSSFFNKFYYFYFELFAYVSNLMKIFS